MTRKQKDRAWQIVDNVLFGTVVVLLPLACLLVVVLK